MIHVDLDHPRVSHTEGEPVFLPKGGNSPYLDHIALVLRGIHAGLEMSKAMFAAFSALDLIEPVSLDVKLSAEEGYNVVGLHTVDQRKLAALDGAVAREAEQSRISPGRVPGDRIDGQCEEAHGHEAAQAGSAGVRDGSLTHAPGRRKDSRTGRLSAGRPAVAGTVVRRRAGCAEGTRRSSGSSCAPGATPTSTPWTTCARTTTASPYATPTASRRSRVAPSTTTTSRS